MLKRMEVRVPEDWMIDYHEFYDEEPEFDEGVCVNLSQDLLQITKESLIIDVGFYRDHYGVMLVRDCDWWRPLRTKDCQSRGEAVMVVEEWARDAEL